MALIIGIAGPLGAGKSTAASELQKAFGGLRLPFAGPLKAMIEALGVAPRHLYGTTEDKAEPLDLFGGKSARHAMQTLGTEWGREQFGPDFWCRAWGAQADRMAVADIIVADDVRFTSEYDAIRARGGLVIQIIRSLDDLNQTPSHPSEAFQLIPYDIRIINDGTRRQLAAKLRRAVGAHFKPKAVEVKAAPVDAKPRRKRATVKPLPAGEVKLVTEGRKSRFVPVDQAAGE